jgi:hypothetical protein
MRRKGQTAMNSPVSKKALRIVLLGRPGAGKSSLLGALAAATPVDASPLRLIDSGNVLGELRRQVESHQVQPTLTAEQVVAYLVTFNTQVDSQPATTTVLLVDCDDGAVQQLFQTEADDFDPLVNEIRRADAIVLAVPTNEATEPEIVQLNRLLIHLEEIRGSALLAGGLPVFLTLTKCDLLVHKDDTTPVWGQRIGEQLRVLDQHFQSFRRQRGGAGVSAFGQVDLQPALATSSLPSPHTFGTPELFGRCLEYAAWYRQSKKRSTWRLLGAAVLLVGLVAGLIAFANFPPSIPSLADREAIRSAVDQEVQWYEKQTMRGKALEQFVGYVPKATGKVPWPSWSKEVDDLLSEARRHTHDPEEPLPGADTATYQVLRESKEVNAVRGEWQAIAEKLQQEVELVSALGMVPPRPERPALLQVPAEFKADQSGDRLRELAQAYPQYKDWSLREIPDPVRRELDAAAEASANNLMKAGQQEILAQLDRLSKGGPENPELWRQLNDWLVSPKELQAWRELIMLLTGLYEPPPDDPIARLKAFLDKSQYDIELRELVLKIPNALNVRPAGKLVIYHGDGGVSFKQLGDGRPSEAEKVTRCTFVPEGGESVTYRLNYRPGDNLWAVLPLKTADGQELIFTWSVCRSQVFQFERLSRLPRLHKKNQLATDGTLAQDVALTVAVGQVPQLPDLIPVVDSSKIK